MKYNHVASLLQTNYTTIQVTFTEGGRIHTYKVKTPHSLVAGEDSVVVKVGTEYRVAQVIAVHDEPQIDTESSTEYQWIVQKVDSKDYEAVLKKEELFIETLQSVEKAKKRAEVLEDFKKHMSISGEAVTLLDDAVKQLNE